MIHTKTNYSRCGKHSILSNCPRSNPQSKMIPRIKSYKPMKDYQLLVAFDDGRIVKYDVMDDIRSIPAFKDLETVYGLFANAQLDSSHTCIYWNDQIDLPSDTIYEYGIEEKGVLRVAEEEEEELTYGISTKH